MSDQGRAKPEPFPFPYSLHADTESMRQRERELYRLLNPHGPKNGMEYRVLGWVRVDTRLLEGGRDAS